MRGQSFGKLAVGIRVVDETSHKLPSFGTLLFMRTLFLVSAYTVGAIFYVWYARSCDAGSQLLYGKRQPQKTGWHDKLTKTVVVKAHKAQLDKTKRLINDLYPRTASTIRQSFSSPKTGKKYLPQPYLAPSCMACVSFCVKNTIKAKRARKDKIFNAFNLTPLSQVKVVILRDKTAIMGQDKPWGCRLVCPKSFPNRQAYKIS